MRRLTTIAAVTTAALALSISPAAASGDANLDAGIVDVVLKVSGDSGFDGNGRDFDLLREALVATDLVGAVAAAEDVTVFAPNDRAFRILASELGWDGSGGEAGALGAIVEATGYVSAADPGLLDDVLLYHVGAERVKVRELYRGGDVTTLLGPELEYRRFRIADADTDDRDARVTFPWFVPADNGNIVVIDRVLRPIDLP